MFVVTKEDEKADGGVAKTSDPDKFVQLAIKSSDSLLGMYVLNIRFFCSHYYLITNKRKSVDENNINQSSPWIKKELSKSNFPVISQRVKKKKQQ